MFTERSSPKEWIRVSKRSRNGLWMLDLNDPEPGEPMTKSSEKQRDLAAHLGRALEETYGTYIGVLQVLCCDSRPPLRKKASAYRQMAQDMQRVHKDLARILNQALQLQEKDDDQV